MCYLLEDEFSFFSTCLINITIFIYTPRTSVESHALLLSLFRFFIARYLARQLPIDGIRKPSKSLKSSIKQSVVNIQKSITQKYNILFILIITIFLQLHQLPQCNVQVMNIAACFMCPVTLFHFSCLKMGCQSATKIAANLFLNNLQKFQKFIVSSISCFGNVQEVSYKD